MNAKMNAVLFRGLAPLINLLTDTINVFIKRDKKVILCGAWMGEKFADNSRFLYQHLLINREKYGIKKIIWVTRSIKIYTILNELGYEVYMMHSLKSGYYHFKAGIYIICNMGFNVKGYKGDTMGHLAGHAIKINTWHGIPIKAGKSTNDNKKNTSIKSQILYKIRTNSLFCSIFTPGHWDKAFYLSTGSECTRRCSIFTGVDKNNFIETGYPRDCITQDYLMDKEINIISRIESFEKVLLYVPTFREHSELSYPLENIEFKQFIERNGYLWIEKSHPAMDLFMGDTGNAECFLHLESDFDINVIMPKITVLITDYSSVCFDAIAYGKPVLYYAPDYEYYLHEERGFLCDYKEFTGKNLSFTIDELRKQILDFFSDSKFEQYTLQRIAVAKSELFDCSQYNENSIVETLHRQLNIFY